ncbi:hypothetical protein AVEN_230428-1 [Araneus ventricosus]|uniref:Uncharacterized protein n=1 Tax=Araneus ventricosus TaxID=182803 RepID=A0A4Y2U1J2_ARAVE|nr:hypothetical protein AVEN_230428-1 [Araneus ventricosus]
MIFFIKYTAFHLNICHPPTLSSSDDTPSSDLVISGDENKSPEQKFFSSALNSFRGVAHMISSSSFLSRRISPLPDLDWAGQPGP